MTKNYTGWTCPDCSEPNPIGSGRCTVCGHGLTAEERLTISRAMSQVLYNKLKASANPLPRTANLKVALDLLIMDLEVEKRLPIGEANDPVSWSTFESLLGGEFLPTSYRGEEK